MSQCHYWCHWTITSSWLLYAVVCTDTRSCVTPVKLDTVAAVCCADAHVGLCKFHRKQAWNRNLANKANKDKLMPLYVVGLHFHICRCCVYTFHFTQTHFMFISDVYSWVFISSFRPSYTNIDSHYVTTFHSIQFKHWCTLLANLPIDLDIKWTMLQLDRATSMQHLPYLLVGKSWHAVQTLRAKCFVSVGWSITLQHVMMSATNSFWRHCCFFVFVFCQLMHSCVHFL